MSRKAKEIKLDEESEDLRHSEDEDSSDSGDDNDKVSSSSSESSESSSEEEQSERAPRRRKRAHTNPNPAASKVRDDDDDDQDDQEDEDNDDADGNGTGSGSSDDNAQVPGSSQSDDDDEVSSSSKGPGSFDIVNFDLEGFPPVDSDLDGIVIQLQQLFRSPPFPMSWTSYAQFIIRQSNVGTVLTQRLDEPLDGDDDDDDNVDDTVFGIITVVNLTLNKTMDIVQELTKFVLHYSEKHATKDVHEKVKALLNRSKGEGNVGFVITNRFVNIPAKLSSIMLTSLLKDIKEAAKKDEMFDFDSYIFITKMYKTKGKNGGTKDVYMHSEEEAWDKVESVNFDFPLTKSDEVTFEDEGGSVAQGDQFRRVQIIKAPAFDKLIAEHQKLLK